MFDNLTESANAVHQDNVKAGWWKQIEGVTQPRNVGELLCLIHSEIDEADSERMDEKLPHRKEFEVELADTAIRVFDMLGFYQSQGTCDANWLQEGLPPLVFPTRADRCEWLMHMHKITSTSMEHFRKSRVPEGCAELVHLLGVIYFAQSWFSIDVEGAIIEKRAYNAQRADHKLENRQAEGGKKF